MLKTALIVGSGGFIGAMLRFLLVTAIRPLHPLFPLATFSVNILGCFLMGVCVSLMQQTPTSSIKYFVVMGILGSLTTFSAFIYDAFLLAQQQAIGLAITYVIGSVIIGMLCFYFGYMVGQ